MTEDLSMFLVDFGESATINSIATVTVLFSNRFDPIAFGADGRMITMVGRTSELGTVVQRDVVRIRATNFTVVSVEPIQDGQFIELRLEEAATTSETVENLNITVDLSSRYSYFARAF